MEKDRGGKLIAVIALVVAIVGLSVGFAAFSTTLNISSNATAQVGGTEWNVGFSANGTDMAALTTAQAATVNGQTGGNNNGAAKLMKYTFYQDTGATLSTTAGSKVEYSFYIKNAGRINASLDSISFGTLTCAYISDAAKRTIEQDASNVGSEVTANTTGTISDADCAAMFNVSFTIDSTPYTSSSTTFNNTIAAGANVPVKLTIEATGNAPTTVPTGDFTVTLGATTVNYKSA